MVVVKTYVLLQRFATVARMPLSEGGFKERRELTLHRLHLGCERAHLLSKL